MKRNTGVYQQPASKELSYSAAGVDIEAGEEAVRLIKKDVESTYIPGVLGSLGGFAGMYELPAGFSNPVLVTATDGVGTKLLLAQETGKLHTVGIDLVAMSVNDVLTVGAKPLLFLDYVATGKLLPAEMVQIVAGVAEGCRQARCALVGGEMAEMPGLYTPGEFDLAGFCVGIGEKNELLDGSAIAEGDVVLGLASSGFHSNGYSLVRKVLEVSDLSLEDKYEDFLASGLSQAVTSATTVSVTAGNAAEEDVGVDAGAAVGTGMDAVSAENSSLDRRSVQSLNEAPATILETTSYTNPAAHHVDVTKFATIADALLEPTRIYVGAVLDLLEAGIPIHGMAHITGGGMVGNLSRVIPEGLSAVLNFQEWQIPPLFSTMQKLGCISEEEMFSAFNMGVGFVLVLPSDYADVATEHLRTAGEMVLRLGKIVCSNMVEISDSTGATSASEVASKVVLSKKRPD